MSDILEFTPFHPTWLHGEPGMGPFQGLHPGQFVNALHPRPFLCQCWRFLVQVVDVRYFVRELRIWRRGQPGADQMGLEIRIF